MRKLIMVAVVLACATVITGCGNPHEKMVNDMYSSLQSGDRDKADKFFKENVDSKLADGLRHNRKTKKVFVALMESKEKEPVKTEILNAMNGDAASVSLISGKCDGTTLYFAVGAKRGTDNKILLITTEKEEAEFWWGLCVKEFVSTSASCDSDNSDEDEPKTVREGPLDRFAERGRMLFAAIIQCNVERSAAGLEAVWPKSKDKCEGLDDDDRSLIASDNSDAYFKCLFDFANKGTDKCRPYVDVDESRAFDSQKVLWNVAMNISDDSDDDTPVLISANFDCNNLTEVFMHDVNKVIPIGTCPVLGNAGIVVVYKNGEVAKLPADKVTLKNILRCSSYAIAKCSYLTPSGIAEIKTVSHFPELELKCYEGMVKSVIDGLGTKDETFVAAALDGVEISIMETKASLRIEANRDDQKAMLKSMLEQFK